MNHSSIMPLKVVKLVEKKVEAYFNYPKEIHLQELVGMVMQSLVNNNIKLFHQETKIIDEKLLDEVIEKLFKGHDLKNILNQNLKLRPNYQNTYSNWYLIKNELVIKIDSKIEDDAIFCLILDIIALSIGTFPVFAYPNSNEKEIRIDLTKVKDKIEAINEIEVVMIMKGWLIDKDVDRLTWKIHK